jgi:hypothetical protein
LETGNDGIGENLVNFFLYIKEKFIHLKYLSSPEGPSTKKFYQHNFIVISFLLNKKNKIKIKYPVKIDTDPV